MVTCSLIGGLGNYMFQVSAAYSLSIDNNSSFVFDINDVFSPHKNIGTYTDNIFRNVPFSENIINTFTYKEKTFHYSKIPYNPWLWQKESGNFLGLKLFGYFQSYKYFSHNRDEVISLFSIDDVSMDFLNTTYGKLLSGDTCSIHVRRGDYVNLPNHHPVCELNYYQKSINLFDKGVSFLIFSDDMQWCKENFKGDNFTFIEGNKDYLDLWLMSICNHNIIANSTFSWWGAWLNQNPDKIVISPNTWFGPSITHNTTDLTPKKWIKL